MNRKYQSLLLLAVLFIASCSGLPHIKPSPPSEKARIGQLCRHPFLTAKYRLVHAIEASLPGGAKTTMIGILLADPKSRTIHSVIMTIEGFVLFDAEHNEKLKINRGIAPFDTSTFAENMMNDIRLIIFAPEAIFLETGHLENGSPVCRYGTGQGMTTDIAVNADNTWDRWLYAEDGSPIRRVRTSDYNEKGIPARIDLQAYGFREYSLQMRLISAEPVSEEKNSDIKDDDL